jgi:phosphonate transport system ATP-binding protein
MRLLCELAHERGTPALVNIHDVGLAQSYADRIIGLAGGQVAFDGTPSQLTHQVLTDIYGEEDWSKTIRKVDKDDKKPKDRDALDRESAAG